MNKIKIIYLIDTFNLAGAEKLLLEFCQKIEQERFDIKVAAVVGGGPLEDDFKKLGIPVKIFSKKSKLDIGLVLQLIKYLRANKPDIVHTHLFAADTWGRIAAVFARVPKIVSTEHNMNIEYSLVKHLIKSVLALFTDKIIAVSEAVKDYSIKKEKISSAKIQVIYNGIDLEKFKLRQFRPIAKNKIKGVLIARLEEQKGPQYLISAMPQILVQYPEFELNLYGQGSLEQDLKKQADDLHISNKVKFLGWTKNPQDILAQMDVFILPSLWEGLGVVLLEAMAIGLPVIASDIPGPQEVITNNQTGLLCPAKDSSAIAEAVIKLIKDEALQEKLVKNARQSIENKFSLVKMVEDYTKLYENLTNK